MKSVILFITIILELIVYPSRSQQKYDKGKDVSQNTMVEIYNEIKTPYKYGIVLKHPDSTKMIDSPTIFRKDSVWYMTYIVYDGQGYETWFAESDNLLNWKTKGKILSFTENTWDANQKAGYMSLVDIEWGGNYQVEKYQNKYWMPYLGGTTKGYEAGTLGVGLAYSSTLNEVLEWNRVSQPVLLPDNKESRWFENKTIYKSLIIHDKSKLTGYPFVMYYNAKGVSGDFESIGMAASNDMVSWKRLGIDPVITRRKGICGDAQIAKINNLYVMFYFGAFWKPGAFERFACSYDLVNWKEWNGNDLIAPSMDYDAEYAHKPWVVKWKGTVYHFYTAVGKSGRVIALATSKEIKDYSITQKSTEYQDKLKNSTDLFYTNPIINYGLADPNIKFEDGYYYLLATGKASDGRFIPIYRSRDLVSWQFVRGAVTRGKKKEWNYKNFWAPEVYKIQGKFYLYYTAMPEVSPSNSGNRVGLAISDSIQGPYQNVGVVVPHASLDGHLFFDSDGSMYIFYTIEHGNKDGLTAGQIYADELISTTKVAGKPVKIISNHTWQEGPFMLHRNDKYYLTYSCGAWTDSTYHVRYAIAKTVMGPYTEQPDTIIKTNKGVKGPGHHSFFTDKKGKDWIVYHGWDPNYTTRYSRIDRIFLNGNKITTDGPTFTPQSIDK